MIIESRFITRSAVFDYVVFLGLEHGGVRKRGGWIRDIKDTSHTWC